MTDNVTMLHNPFPDEDIEAKIKQNWGVGRLFRFLRKSMPYHGETLVLAQILHLSVKIDQKYHIRSVSRVVNTMMKEKVDPQAKAHGNRNKPRKFV